MLVMFRKISGEDFWVNPYYVQQVEIFSFTEGKGAKAKTTTSTILRFQNSEATVTEDIDKVVRKLHLGMGYRLEDPQVGGVKTDSGPAVR